MSNLALLVGAKPNKDKIGPIVYLEKGDYVARLENVQDSVIMLCNHSGLIGRLTQGTIMQLEAGDYFTHITTAGKEKYVNASLTRV